MIRRIEIWLRKIYIALLEAYGHQKTSLKNSTPLQLMVSAILSAQCTDAKVNSISPGLFRKYHDAEDFAKADCKELEEMIKPIGLYHSKASNIMKACRRIVDEFGSEIPADMKSLVSLPGIGRKTANVILGHGFGIPGFPVDTHVKRVLNRIGVISDNNPVRIEFVVIKNLPDKVWTEFSLLLIRHGRNRCKARRGGRPDCKNCEIRNLCNMGSKFYKETIKMS